MKKYFCCLLVIVFLFSVTAVAKADPLEEAFRNGTVGGHVAAYGQTVRNREAAPGDPKREGFGSASASIDYRTAPLMGFSLGLGAWGTTRLGERNDGDYRAAIAENALFHKAFISYQIEDLGGIVVGRQDVDLEWLDGYIQGVTGTADLLPGLKLAAGWAHRRAEIELDEVSERFEKTSGNKGLYFMDARYSPAEWLSFNPYYYEARDLFRAPGLKLTASFEPVEGFAWSTMAQFVRSSASTASGMDNGDYFQAEQVFAYGDFSLYGGIAVADKKGVGGLDGFGDHQPLEEGNRVFETDARTWYLGLGYEWGDLSLAALYGLTRYEDGGRVKERELNLVAGYEVIKNMELELICADVRNDDRPESYRKASLAIIYRF